jgi:hypothetical protein
MENEIERIEWWPPALAEGWGARTAGRESDRDRQEDM